MSFLKNEAGAAPRLVLPAVVDLPVASILKQDCQSALAGGEGLIVDAESVSRVTSPCLQVLVAAARAYAASGGPPLRFGPVSDGFAQSVSGLALDAEFGFGETA